MSTPRWLGWGKEHRERNVVQLLILLWFGFFFFKAKILNITKQFKSISLHENAIALELCNLSGQYLKGN